MKIPFSPPYIDQDVIDSVSESLSSGWITTGPKVKALEELVQEQTGAKRTLCVNSATSGLMLSLKWFGVGSGDEVIIPAYTYAATALAVIHVGATPVMVDVEDDFNVSISAIENAVTEKTKAIVPVDFSGWPCDYGALQNLVTKVSIRDKFCPNSDKQKALGRILLLADAAHSIGATYKGRNSGTLADLTVFSFHAVKNITTAEGGAVCIALPEPFDCGSEYALMRLMTLNGQTKDAFTKTKAGGWKYDIVLPGMKINMPDVCASIGLAQLRKYPSLLLPERKRVAEFYVDNFRQYDWALIPPLRGQESESSYHVFALRIEGITEVQRDEMIRLISEKGVAVNVHFTPLPMLSLFKEMGFKISGYPQAYANYSKEISLPIYPQLTEDELAYIVGSVAEAYSCVVLEKEESEAGI
ncbi:aminotransferase [Fulvitalea axinellae]|uniref:Aminotransferase n=1 Tax=Fulvitalea axinellae TaxID=1182444 RepID=A0AAU9CWP0_9BACT|nr:aminotransferase [Fulvitalea axinellae]